jgi:hypothetical protein
MSARKGSKPGCNQMRGVSAVADRRLSAAPIQSGRALGHHEGMNYDTSSIPNVPRPEREAAEAGSLHSTRAAPWEPGGARTSRVLIGVVGAALVGAFAIGGVMLTPSRHVPRAASGDEVATAPQSQQPAVPSAAPAMTADQMAAQSQQQPAAAGAAPAQAPSAAAAASDAQAPAQAMPGTPAQPGSADASQSPATKPGSDQ